MHTIEVNEIWTLLVALPTISLGTRVIARAAPRAFLVVTLAASLVQDLINAGVVQAALTWAAREVRHRFAFRLKPRAVRGQHEPA
jgi:uncharacterized protein (DUF1778 family)